MKKLKIAQLVLPWLSLPPKGYAGTERIVFWLSKELAKMGHQVTLFSVGDSTPPKGVKLEYIFEKPLGLQKNVANTIKTSPLPFLHVANCFGKAKQFDIIHSHSQFLGLTLAELVKTPTLHTFHRTLKEGLQKEEHSLLLKHKNLNFASISNSQRALKLNFIDTVYNGIPIEQFPYAKEKGEFLLFVGRLVDKKGPLEAILTAKALNMSLIIIGNITDTEFFDKKIKPHIDQKQIRYLGELPQEKIANYYKKTLCLLCPVKWNEPFGLTAVEGMACGTPVIAFNNGGLKETVKNKETGFLVPQKQGVAGLKKAVQKIDTIKRSACRDRVVKYFSVQTMAKNYEKVYHTLTNKK